MKRKAAAVKVARGTRLEQVRNAIRQREVAALPWDAGDLGRELGIAPAQAAAVVNRLLQLGQLVKGERMVRIEGPMVARERAA